MTLPEFLHRGDDGVIRIEGHRLRMIDVALRCNEGFSAEEILRYYEALSLPLLHKVIAFYLENERAVADLIAADRKAMDELEARSRKGPTLSELRARLETRRPRGLKFGDHVPVEAGPKEPPSRGDPAALLAADLKWVGDPAEVDALLSEVQRMRGEDPKG